MNKLTIRFKLITIFVLTSLGIFVVNAYICANINKIASKANTVYISNMTLNEMSEALNTIQESVTDYLNTKTSESLQSYYYAEQVYRELLTSLNGQTVEDEILMMEKNIKNLSENYLKVTNETVKAKRARNIRKYNAYYEKSIRMFEYIRTSISSLNNKQFKDNTSNYQAFLKSLGSLGMIGIIILIIVMLFNIGMIYILTYRIIYPLIRLAETAGEVAKGNFDVELIRVECEDEVGRVARAFNHMIVSIQTYIAQIRHNLELENKMKEKELMMASHLKEAELKYLQAQINPHFLFNTLNASVQLAMMEDAEMTGLFIENMAEFFRYTMRKMDKDTSLGEEIKLVDHYIYIINVRFAGEIGFEKKIDESLLNVRVPSMILQPIVENAINYGIREIEWEGKIELSVYETDQLINISIKDNGIGIDKAKIQEIMDKKIGETSENKSSNGIGLANVMDRLKLYYDKVQLLEILSEGKDQGTTVIIHIPKEIAL